MNNNLTISTTQNHASFDIKDIIGLNTIPMESILRDKLFYVKGGASILSPTLSERALMNKTGSTFSEILKEYDGRIVKQDKIESLLEEFWKKDSIPNALNLAEALKTERKESVINLYRHAAIKGSPEAMEAIKKLQSSMDQKEYLSIRQLFNRATQEKVAYFWQKAVENGNGDFRDRFALDMNGGFYYIRTNELSKAEELFEFAKLIKKRFEEEISAALSINARCCWDNERHLELLSDYASYQDFSKIKELLIERYKQRAPYYIPPYEEIRKIASNQEIMDIWWTHISSKAKQREEQNDFEERDKLLELKKYYDAGDHIRIRQDFPIKRPVAGTLSDGLSEAFKVLAYWTNKKPIVLFNHPQEEINRKAKIVINSIEPIVKITKGILGIFGIKNPQTGFYALSKLMKSCSDVEQVFYEIVRMKADEGDSKALKFLEDNEKSKST